MMQKPDIDAIGRRLEEFTGLPVRSFLSEAVIGSVDPLQSASQFERWLQATGSPSLYLDQLTRHPKIAGGLMRLFGASQALADSLIQNPELAHLFLEPDLLQQIPTRDTLLEQGERLLKASTSYSHALDRMRFLRQEWQLRIAWQDLDGGWPQETVWHALSVVAEALVELCVGTVWGEFRKGRDLPEVSPISVVGFGKLGGDELNYSSDIDLAYLLDDDADENTERACIKFCEMLTRAIGDRMGRGSLYRVDLRLRPYGASGPILNRMRAVESYYELYAEPWEVQALLRSRVIAGNPDRWERMREARCFKPKTSELILDSLSANKARIEELADERDLKRGAGGIRDIEFLVQAFQMVYGYHTPPLRTPATCAALRALDEAGLLPHSVCDGLIENYTFLRQLEHRCQIGDDRQTHSLPTQPEQRSRLARLMRFESWDELEIHLARTRTSIHRLYQSLLNPHQAEPGVRQDLITRLGAIAPAFLLWFDSFPESNAFYESLLKNEDSLRRVRAVIEESPTLVPYFRRSVALTEMLLSGEIEEESLGALRALNSNAKAQEIANAFVTEYVSIFTRSSLDEHAYSGGALTRLVDELLSFLAVKLELNFDLIALGSYGRCELSPRSDGDLLLLVESREAHDEAEKKAQTLLKMLDELKRYSLPISFDLRLRPEGGSGLLVRTYEGFLAYSGDAMEAWERFALLSARLVWGSEKAVETVQRSFVPLNPEMLDELLAMKKRIETERVSAPDLDRHIKLGHGALGDLEWLSNLCQMRYPLGDFVEIGLFTQHEWDRLQAAQGFLLNVRQKMALLGFSDDLIPEQNERLSRLARSFEGSSAVDFLERYQVVTRDVRALFQRRIQNLRDSF